MRLDVLRRYRAQIEEEMQVEWAERDAAVAAAVRTHAAHRRAAEEEASQYVAAMQSGVNGVELSLRDLAWQGRRAEVDRAEQAVLNALQARERKQAELAVARRDRKQMERLIERRTQVRQDRLRRQAQRDLDDFANARWAGLTQEVGDERSRV